MLVRRSLAFVMFFIVIIMMNRAQDGNFATLIADNPNLSTFNSLATNEINQINEAEGSYLVFAPSNAAFETLPARVMDYLNANPELLAHVLRYHIAQDNAGTAMSLDGESLDFVGTAVDAVTITGEIPARNGRLYLIDSLLLPEITLPELDYAALTGELRLDGSATVAPITQSILSSFASLAPNVQLNANVSGTVEGFQAFCFRLEADLVGASRMIRSDEQEICQINNLYPLGFQIGTDAVAVIVKSNNDFVESLSLEQLAFVFSDPRDATGAVIRSRLWSDINPAWPAAPIQRYFPSQAHGTFDYFVERIFQAIYMGIADGSLALANYDFYSPVDFYSEGLFAPDGTVILENGTNLAEAIQTLRELGDLALIAELTNQQRERTIRPLVLSQERVQEDDFDQLRRETAQNSNAIGFVAYSYLAEDVRAVAINDTRASVLNINQGTYPLSRPLLIYSDAGMMQSSMALSGFIHYYLKTIAAGGLPEGFFPTNPRNQRMARLEWLSAIALGN